MEKNLEMCQRASQVALVVKNLPANVGDARALGSTSGWGRFPGGGNGDPLQYSCLENSMHRGAQGVTVHGITMSDLTEKARITHAQILSQLLHATLYP